ncbi:hypothetical protein B0H16DRAFT_1806570 [Mycena metata]|uniref:Uncharacterized protein n=1 Tax=Mycena metata TaxID=1033252 RepID=A0AAD7H8C8_9AGAR|nr:hypothetical protein B0H16DRAFT_1806570 [Mycena metata]
MFVGPEEINNLTDGFRIFTREKLDTPTYLPTASLRDRIAGDKLTISIAGAARNAGTANATAGSGAWFGHGLQNISLKLPDDTAQSASNAEVIAALESVRQSGNQTELTLESSSNKNKNINALKTNLPKWENRGWIGVPERQPLQALVAALTGVDGDYI